MKQSLLALAVVLGVSALSSGARAQMPNGIDYFNQSEAGVNALKQQLAHSQQDLMQQQTMAVQNLMADPRVQAMYQQHQAQGGRMPYAEFAYQYGLTGGFTPQGKAYATQVLRQNTQQEHQSWLGWQGAQGARGQAQQNWQSGYAANQYEAGNGLRGTSTWIDPMSGASYQLPHAAANTPTYDPRTGRYFQMDGNGNYYVSTPQGTWAPMTPYR